MKENSTVHEMNQMLSRLFPLCRSITGADNIQSLEILQEVAPFDLKSVRTGTTAYDWQVPREWIVRDAFIQDSSGEKHLTFADNNLHLVNFSTPVDAHLDWLELKDHLHSDPALPAAVPYRTTYYNEDWGFSGTAEELAALEEAPGPYRAYIDTQFIDGELVFGELLIPGRFEREILISTYFCHPSLANDNLSGMVLTAFLAKQLLKTSTMNKWSYRIVFVPETIGALVYCSLNEAAVKKIDVGFVVTTVGGPDPLTLKKSWNENHYLNGIAERVIRRLDSAAQTVPFDVHGSDERQYSSPGFRVNSVTIGKSLYYTYPQYHSSLDDLDFISPSHMEESLSAYEAVLSELEDLRFFRRTEKHGEPMLSKRNLYTKLGGGQRPLQKEQALDMLLWVLFLSDGSLPTSAIAEQLAAPLDIVEDISLQLCAFDLLEEI